MKTLVLFAFLLGLLACNNGETKQLEGSNSDSTAQANSSTIAPQEEASPIAEDSYPTVYTFQLEPLGENEMGVPYTQIYVEHEVDGDVQRQAVAKVMGEAQSLGEDQYAAYSIPADAEQPIYSFWAGSGQAFFIHRSEQGVTVKETFQDESGVSSAQAKVVLTLE